MKTNTKTKKATVVTHEGAPAKRITPLEQLRRTVLATLLFEDGFYEDGVSVAERIKDLTQKVKPEEAVAVAIEARNVQKLRHAPLMIAIALAKSAKKDHRLTVSKLLPAIIQRPDEITEFLALYWKEGKTPISAQVKKGLASCFNSFSEYSFAKYNRDADIRLRDVMFLVHPRPKDEEQKAIFAKIASDTLATPDTWEVALSGGADKAETFTRLIKEGKLGALALMRNLRNMVEARVSRDVIRSAIASMDTRRVLPFRFITAERHAPTLSAELEGAMFSCLGGTAKLPGKTIILVDISGSMGAKVSSKSEVSRQDAACGVAIILREICEDVVIMPFDTTVHTIPNRRGFALRDEIIYSVGGGTRLGDAVRVANGLTHDRLIVITDEQSADAVLSPVVEKAYMVNVGNNRNGVGYGKWVHIDGWSEGLVRFIQEYEGVKNATCDDVND
jgi:60 kDa SS-A/Ro ribonucleoprotein